MSGTVGALFLLSRDDDDEDAEEEEDEEDHEHLLSETC